MTAGWDYAATAETLVRYFARMEATEGPAWTAGRVAAEAWRRLVLTGSATPTDLDTLSSLIEVAEGDGSALIELRLAVVSWSEALPSDD